MTGDVIDMLLDQEGFECDPLTDREGDTPLHCVVRWINGASAQEKDAGIGLVEMMLEAGNDPRSVPSAHSVFNLLPPAELLILQYIESVTRQN